MNKEKFLRQLGITTGEWVNEKNSIISVNNYIGICQTSNRVEDDYCNAAQNSKLICAAPDMLIALIDSVRFFDILMKNIETEKENELKFYNYVEKIYNEKRKIIKNATGKTWAKIMQIWEECQE